MPYSGFYGAGEYNITKADTLTIRMNVTHLEYWCTRGMLSKYFIIPCRQGFIQYHRQCMCSCARVLVNDDKYHQTAKQHTSNSNTFSTFCLISSGVVMCAIVSLCLHTNIHTRYVYKMLSSQAQKHESEALGVARWQRDRTC